MDFDHILEYVGEFGKYQMFIYFLLFASTIPLGANIMSFVFNSAIPDHRCLINECENENENASFKAEWIQNVQFTENWISSCTYKNIINVETCSISNLSYENVRCNKWVFDQSVFQSTIVSEWNLVCDQSWLNTLSATTWMIGMTVGALTFGQLSDRYGRKFALTNAAALNVIISFVLPFSLNYVMFLILRFIQAMVCAGFYETATILSLEFVGHSKRVFCSTGLAIGFCLGSVFMGALAYAVPNWRQFHFYLAFPCVVYIIYYWILPESARWLIAQKKYQSAVELIQKMARVNQTSVPDKILDTEKAEIVDSPSVSSSPGQLFKNKVLRRRTIQIFLIWCLVVFGYYGISMNTVNLGGNIFLNFILASLIELPALIFCLLVLDRAGRRIPLVLLLLTGGLFCLATSLIPKTYTHWLTVGFVLVAKFGVSAGYAIIILFTAELLPTCVRNSGLGMSAFFANAGAMIAPYVSSLNSHSKDLPLIVFGLALLVSGILAFNLPETLGKVLPETIEDAETFGLNVKDKVKVPDVYVVTVRKHPD